MKDIDTTKIVARRFWAKVDKSGDCWLWRGGRDRWGYGRAMMWDDVVSAHRVAYALTHGSIPPGAHVLHSCDNPSCVRPEHLRAGTHAENIAEAAQKARMHGHAPFGRRNHMAKLSPRSVRLVRRLRGEGVIQAEIARRLKVGETTIYNILKGKTWTHVV